MVSYSDAAKQTQREKQQRHTQKDRQRIVQIKTRETERMSEMLR